MLMSYVLPIVLVLALIYTSIKILMEYERGVIFFLGKFQTVKGPGLIIVIPGLQKMMRVNLQTVTMDVPSQDVITRDNVSVKVNAVIFFRVVDPQRAILAVQDYLYSTSQIAQTTLRSVLGQSQLDELLSKREEINVELQRIIDQQTEPWGVKVSAVEVKNVDLPQEMLRAIAKQAEAERERRAKVIHAEGELQAAATLSEAAGVLTANPAAIQLRYLQTLSEIGAEQNSTIVFPLPIDLIKPLLAAADATAPDKSATTRNGELPEGEEPGGLPRVALGGSHVET
jgi:regulator of protease activity HflC (stomatin/prohibitin superfamily)